MKVFLIGVLLLCGLYSTQSASVSIDPTSLCAGQQGGSFISVPGECSQFLICLNGKGLMKSCGPRLHFDPESRSCIEESLSLCKQRQEEELVVEEIPAPQNICSGKMTGAFMPSTTSCNEYYVCVGSEPILKQCKTGLHFNPDTRSCVDPILSSCVVKNVIPMTVNNEQSQGIKPQEVQQQVPLIEVVPRETIPQTAPQQMIPVPEIIFAATACLGQPNGALFAVPGSCTKYFACMQQRALEQSCGLRHFNPLTRSCIDAFTSECVEGDLGDLFLPANSNNVNTIPIFTSEVVGETKPDDIILGNANLIPKESGIVNNEDLGESNGQNVAALGSNGDLSDIFVISGGKLISNNKVIPIKAAGLPVYKKQISQVNAVDIADNNLGASIDEA